MASKKIDQIEGIGLAFAGKLAMAGIKSTDDLLSRGRTKQGRQEIAEHTGIPEAKVLHWVNMADLFRIKGVGSEYAELLEAAGVDTVKELQHRNPQNLTEKMVEINAAKRLTRKVPSTKVVEQWVAAAKTMPAGVEH